MKVIEIQPILDIRRHSTVFPSYFNNIYLKYFRILQNLTRNYEILRKLTKVDECWQKLWYSMIFSRSNHLLLFCFVQLRCTISISWFCNMTNEIFLFDNILFRLQATSGNISPLSNERWFSQYCRYLGPLSCR